MKKNFAFLVSALMLTVGTIILTGCGEDDTTPPVITLVGDNPLSLSLGDSYQEEGATATDDKDGDLTSSIVITGADAIDEDQVGAYNVNYSVSDAAGNVGDAIRAVNVVNDAEPWAGSYTVKDTCGVDALVFNYAQTVTTSTVVNNRVKFNKFADYSGNTGIYANISGNAIDLPSQTATAIGSMGETHTFQGSGFKTSNGFVLTYTDINVSQGGASTTCVAHYTK
ncbi:MAG: DUF5011 domain-containing protein [Bacteroidetes bacterium]|nr:DUF5011 domain-containing protein [Bacteroidota bacterium]